MKKLSTIWISLAMVFCLAGMAAAATDTATHDVTMNIADIAVMDVSGGDVEMEIVAQATGGVTPSNPTNSSTRLDYTTVNDDGRTRTITAQMSAAAPSGTSLKLAASPPAGCGTTANQQTLSNSLAQTLITSIPSCATGSGSGATLAYEFSLDDIASLKADGDTTVEITFTVTEDE